MNGKTQRLLLHIAGAIFLLCFIPLGQKFGLGALVASLLLALACFTIAGFIKPRTSGAREPYVSPYRVEFDDLEVRVFYQGKLHESAKWSDLTAVGVRIDESFLPAPWWMLFTSAESGCMYPSEAAGGQEMLRAMQERLRGFDNAAVIESMGLMEGGRLVWSKEMEERASTQESVQDHSGQQREQP